MKVGRSWCYTWHDPKMERISWEEVGNVRMAVWQLEKAPTTGKLHHQGYVEFTKPARMGVLQRAMRGVHVEVRRGTREQAMAYCRKEESREAGPWSYGFIEGNEGQMVDFNRLTDMLNRGVTAQEVQKQYPMVYMKYGAKIKSYIADLQHHEGNERTERARLVVFAGQAGTGKTLTVQAWSKKGGLRVYERSMYEEKYWPGYEKQEVLLLDEFMGDKHAGLEHLNMLATSARCILPQKHSQAVLQAKIVFICSNMQRSLWYPRETPDRRASLERRVDLDVWFERDPRSVLYSRLTILPKDVESEHDCPFALYKGLYRLPLPQEKVLPSVEEAHRHELWLTGAILSAALDGKLNAGVMEDLRQRPCSGDDEQFSWLYPRGVMLRKDYETAREEALAEHRQQMRRAAEELVAMDETATNGAEDKSAT